MADYDTPRPARTTRVVNNARAVTLDTHSPRSRLWIHEEGLRHLIESQSAQLADADAAWLVRDLIEHHNLPPQVPATTATGAGPGQVSEAIAARLRKWDVSVKPESVDAITADLSAAVFAAIAGDDSYGHTVVNLPDTPRPPTAGDPFAGDLVAETRTAWDGTRLTAERPPAIPDPGVQPRLGLQVGPQRAELSGGDADWVIEQAAQAMGYGLVIYADAGRGELLARVNMADAPDDAPPFQPEPREPDAPDEHGVTVVVNDGTTAIGVKSPPYSLAGSALVTLHDVVALHDDDAGGTAHVVMTPAHRLPGVTVSRATGGVELITTLAAAMGLEVRVEQPADVVARIAALAPDTNEPDELSPGATEADTDAYVARQIAELVDTVMRIGWPRGDVAEMISRALTRHGGGQPRHRVEIPTTGDDEVDAMGIVHQVLHPLDADTRRRVAGWVHDRWARA